MCVCESDFVSDKLTTGELLRLRAPAQERPTAPEAQYLYTLYGICLCESIHGDSGRRVGQAVGAAGMTPVLWGAANVHA